MSVLLSIKPKYCERIKNGQKQYEFRKVIFKKDVSKVYIYSSSPVKKIIASFDIGTILDDSPTQLWRKCNESSGLTKSEFFGYFGKSSKGYALKIENIEFFNPINPYEVSEKFTPPQSFYYFNPKDWL
ncbi:MAG: hypothetical protein ACTSQY_09400 [Candidatus Odinarchaeia archaeon]